MWSSAAKFFKRTGMRKVAELLAIGLIGAGPVLLGAMQTASAQTLPRFGTAPAPAAAPAANPQAAATPQTPPQPAGPIPGVSPAKQPCNNPDALGIGRVVE